MHPVIEKTFGGLSTAYYLRQMFFATILAALIIYMLMQGSLVVPVGIFAWLAVSVFLYPYSRYVYESVIGFIVGNNVFWVRTTVALTVKLITMLMCFLFSVFIAPIGLAFLYFYHSRQERLS